MKILKQLEAIIEKEGLNESAKQFYLREISELDKEKHYCPRKSFNNLLKHL